MKECRACRMRMEDNVSVCPRCFGLQFKHIENELEHKLPKEVVGKKTVAQKNELRPNQGTVAITKRNYVPVVKQDTVEEVPDVDEFEYETKDYFFIQLKMAIPIFNLIYVISKLSSQNTPIHIKCIIKSRLIMGAITIALWALIAILTATVFKEVIYSLY